MNPEDIIYARTPGRVDLAGTGTDLSPYREEYGGQLLSAAIRTYSYARLMPRQDRRLLLNRVNDGPEVEADLDDLPGDGPLAPILALIRQAKPERGFELTLSTDLPPRSGLAADTSLGVAVQAVLEEFAGRLIEKESLSQTVYRFGSTDLGLRALHHEPYACALGGFTDVEVDGEVVVRKKFIVKESVKMTLEANSLLAYVNGLQTPETDEVYAACMEESGAFTDAQHRMKATSEAARDALVAGDLRAFATFVGEDWLAYRNMHPSLLPERLERLVEAGRGAGARGAKVCGLCGCGLFFICDDLTARTQVAETLKREGCTILPFHVDELGVDVWRQPQPDS